WKFRATCTRRRHTGGTSSQSRRETLSPTPWSGPSRLGTVYAVVLAAGRSERFGGTKLLATWRGRPLLGHVLGALRPSLESRLLAGGCVVVPADSPAVAALASEAGMVPLPNHAPASGLSSSLRI